MRADAPIIATPDQLDPAWLTAALRAGGAAPPTAEVTAIGWEPIGDGKLGDTVRVALTWSGAEDGAAPSSVVAKFASSDPQSRMAGLTVGTYLREIGFYRELAPVVGGRSPDCWVAEMDETTGELVLLLEDLSPARTGEQVAGCTVDEVALALEMLADLHASTWGGDGLDGRPWLLRRDRDGGEALGNLYDGLVNPFRTQYADRLSERADAVTDAFTGRAAEWISHDADLPPTLLHGDFRAENLLFGTAAPAPPVAVVDWQTPAIGPGPSDVAYLLGGSLPTEERRTHERELVELYRSALGAGGVELGADACWQAYVDGAPTGLHMAVVASVLVARAERSDDMFLAMAERHAAHVDDLGAPGARTH